MSSLYQYFGNENYQPVKSPVPPELLKGPEDDDATPTASNSKRRQRSVIVEIPIGSDPDSWVGSELQVTRTDSTISNEEITLDGSSRKSSRDSGSELGADDISSVEIGDLSSNEDLETSSSGSSSFGIKYNNYSAKRSPNKKDEPEMEEMKDLGFYTLGISKQPGDRTHRAYVQLTPNNQERGGGEPSLLVDVTETSSEMDGHNGGLWRGMNEEAEQKAKMSEKQFTKKRNATWIILLLFALAVVAVAIAVGVTQTGKNDSGKESSLTSLSAPQPSTFSKKPTVPSRSPIRVPPPSAVPTRLTTTAPPSLTVAAPTSEPVTSLSTATPSKTATQSPSSPSSMPSFHPSIQKTKAPSAATPAPSAATKAPTFTPSQPPSSNPTPAPIPNGICSGAYGPLQTNGAVELGKTVGSSITSIFSCGSTVSESGAWYTVVGTGDIFNASTCNESTNYKAKLAVFTGSCGNLACVDANYNGYRAGTCQDGASTISWLSQPQVLYFIFVHGDSGASGSFGLEIHSTPASTYASCNSTSTLLPSDGSVTLVTTMGAELVNAGTCGATSAGYGVWFYVNGTGNLITADTCNSGSTLDTLITIFTGNCDTLSCIAGNDDFCGLQSSISWTSVAGEIYHVLVATKSATGSFGLTIAST